MKQVHYIVPIYGLRSLKGNIKLDKTTVLRNVDIFNKEDEFLTNAGLPNSYNVVLDIKYKFNETNPEEPIPGLNIKILNKIDACLILFEKCDAGLAAILQKQGLKYTCKYILSTKKPILHEYLKIKSEKDFVDYFKKFQEAYSKRPLAFDIFRKSSVRFTNNDKAIDSCTILESIFVPNGERAKKQFIINGMKIMGFEETYVQAINDLIDYRNAIIHADQVKTLKLLSGPKYTYVWFENTFEVVRKVLLGYVDKPWD